MADISSIKLPSGTTYTIVDSGARTLYKDLNDKVDAFTGVSAIVCSQADNTPKDVSWVNSSQQTITGTLEPSSDRKNFIYLVKSGDVTDDIYVEYICVLESASSTTYKWEIIGKTSVDLTSYQKKINSITVTAPTLSKKTDTVLGTSTTFTNSSSSISFQSTDYTAKSALGENATFTATGTGVSFPNASTANVLTENVTGTVQKTVALSSSDVLPSSTTAVVDSNVVTSGATRYLTASAANPTINMTKGVKLKKTSITGVKESADVLSAVKTAGDPGVLQKYEFSVSDNVLTITEKAGTLPSFPTYDTKSVAIADTETSNIVVSDSTIDTNGIDIVTGATATAGSISLKEETTTSTGAVEYIKNITTSSNPSISFSNNTAVKAITSIGESTKTDDTLTVTLNKTNNTATVITALGEASITNPEVKTNSKDTVNAITSITSGTAEAQIITVTPSSVTALNSETAIAESTLNATINLAP